MTLPKKILVPLDFSESSDYALEYAVELARRLEAEITVLHVYDAPFVGFPDSAMMVPSTLSGELLTQAKHTLAKTVERYQGKGVPLTGVLKEDQPWKAIVATAEESGIGLIVMGTHGRHGFSRALLGSVAEKIVRMSPCPVLTVHLPKVKS